MSLDFTKPETLRTRLGRPIRIYAIDGGVPFQIHGAWYAEVGGWTSAEWTLDGTRGYPDAPENGIDLVQVKPRIKRTLWVNVYNVNVSQICHPTEEMAKRDRSTGCLGCRKVELDLEEGEGL